MPPADPPTLGTTGKPGDASKLPSGGAWWDTHGSQVTGATSALAPLLLSLFGDNPYKGQRDTATSALGNVAKMLTKEGGADTVQGHQALAPVLQYLLAVTGADPAALGVATQPERAKVLDQYDTARKSLEFSPRGGGTASATMQAGARSASDIATITANARSKGFDQLAGLGKGLLDTGISTTAAGGSAYSQQAKLLSDASSEQDKGLSGLFTSIGAAIPDIMALFL